MSASKYQITERPVSGTKYKEPEPVDQMTAEDFLKAVDALLAVEGVEGIRWTQYTPYFNDGDPCEFSVHEASVRLGAKFGYEPLSDSGESDEGKWYDEDEEDGWVDDYSLYTYDPTIPRPEYAKFSSREEYNGAYNQWIDDARQYFINGQSTREVHDALKAFNALSGSFESVVKFNFGDHAQVTALPSGFSVEEYSHD